MYKQADKAMTEKQLKDIFQLPFAFQNWKPIFEDIFPVIEYLHTPAPVDDSSGKTKSILQIGTVRLLNNRNIILLQAEVKRNIQIVKNRRELRDIAARFIDQTNNHGILIFYFSEDKKQVDYRLSLISRVSEIDEDGQFQKFETAKKRYTYVLGKNESGTTAAKRLLELSAKSKQKNAVDLKDVVEAFSVEALNKDFFIRYKKQFEKFSGYLAQDKRIASKIFKVKEGKTKEEQAKNEKPIRDFTKKLLGRIVFLHFLQKKGWLGCLADTEKWIDGDKFFIQNLFRNYKDQKHFHSECLKELFFNTLNNNRRKNFIFSITKTRVPYLNGGLFDDDMPATQEIDFPIDYFKDLFGFFDQYNFTIDENSPEEHEVGIDPEMLGHIFENLLEENREKGAFYTPKEIVHYMCQESLIQYLQTHLGKHKAIEDFIRTGSIGDKKDKNNFIVKNAKQIEELLDDVKICDPAIGSGAFPMGILQEIFKAKTALDLTLDRAKAKKDIIQNTIYGVDIEKGAVDIARLRFWLALVVDEEGPQPLPNLDYKIMQGNSLLEQFDDIDLKFEKKKFEIKIVKAVDLFGRPVDPQTSITEFLQTKQAIAKFSVKELEDKYFNSNNSEEKESIRAKIEEFEKEFISAQLKEKEDNIKEQLKSKQREMELDLAAATSSAMRNHVLKGRRAKEIDKLKAELERIKDNKKRLAAIEPEQKPYFLWHLYFMDVFDKGGFDIVIGNPPYIQLQKMGEDCDDLEKASYDTYTRTGDIYCLFYEQGNNLLKDDGVLTFITSNKWMNAAYGKHLRKYLLEDTNPLLLIDFSKTVVFPAAVVFVNILMFRNESNNNQMNGVKAQADFQIGKTPLADYVNEKSVELKNLNDDNWSVAEKLDFEITKRVEEVGIAIKNWDLKFFRGITSGFTHAFHITEDDRATLIRQDKKSKEIIKPLLRGKDIKRWKYDYQKLYIINSHNGVREENIPRIDVENDYPAIYKYLLQFYDKKSPKAVRNEDGTYQTLKDRQDQGDHWTNLRNCAFIQEFEREKIIWIEISDRANYCLDTEGHYLTNSAYFITGKNLKYLLALLNSRLMDFYFFQKTAQIAGGRKRYTKQYVELLPIPQLDDEILIRKFEIIVEYLIFLNDVTKPQVNPYTENTKLAPVFEDVLNMMVYELYFKDHMKEEEIDVLKYIDTEKLFKDLSTYKEDEEKKSIISKAYSKLQEQDNPIRNRIISSNIKSKDIIRRVNSTTH